MELRLNQRNNPLYFQYILTPLMLHGGTVSKATTHRRFPEVLTGDLYWRNRSIQITSRRVYQIKLEVKEQVFFISLDSGSFATWLFCNYHPISLGMNENFYTPTSENFIAPQKFKDELDQTYVDALAYMTFKECGPELNKEMEKEKGSEDEDEEPKKLPHMCFRINYDKWGHVTAALVEDNVLISSSKAAPISIKFGCGFSFDDSMATVSYGILGLGNMSISVPNQLAAQGLIDHVVGLCFSYGVYQVDYDQNHANPDPVGYLVLGQPLDYDVGYQWIPMGEKPGCRYVCKKKHYKYSTFCA
ncbi:hypothetical protein M758_2G234600, partial [Ceratodon purpureus]